ncbi:hypothetical protein ACRAWD_25165 [Caulobacter segnis]
MGKVSLSLTETFYGKASALSDPGTGPLLNTVASAAALTDAELSYKFVKERHRRDRGQQPVQQVSGQVHGRLPSCLYASAAAARPRSSPRSRPTASTAATTTAD